ncbi:hypothetical protein [Parendozoicomonas haliclonae]|uniref:Uncharacterized protein n=1 Tax=Parendozoicomonas haliclonae TaxID=1960125 RepID=A0A1X7ADP5_9GAMM|nr:hypothetical protein [Parendozoicomonas haliclonae]SMA32346.1 hypothetical protein EHSB41UT_00145 [Parendozoicomonas haliclonae]
MSMNVNGGGGVRPLGPPPQQTQVQKTGPQSDPRAAEQQRPGQSGPVINSVNQFTSQPVSNDLQQLQQWLNNLRNADRPELQKPLTSTPQQQPQVAPQQQPPSQEPHPLQTAQKQKEQAPQATKPENKPEPKKTEAPPAKPAPAETAPTKKPSEEKKAEDKKPPAKPEIPPPPPELTKKQSQMLTLGLSKMADSLDVNKSDLARLAFAKASGNDGQFFFQLGKMNHSPTSSMGKKIQMGLEKLFKAVDGPKARMADAVVPSIVADDVARMAKASKLIPSQVLDLGALTHNEGDRFKELAGKMGIPADKADKIMDGFKALGNQFDLSAEELDKMLGQTSQSVNTFLGREFKSAAQSLKMEPQVFNDLANAVMTKDTGKFKKIAKEAGIDSSRVQQTLTNTTKALVNIRKNPAVSTEKLLRFSKDAGVQSRIESAGKEFGLKPDQAMMMAGAFVDEGLIGFAELSKEYGLKRSNDFLNKLEEIEKQQGDGALMLSTNNVESIIAQRRLVKDLKLQTKPISWNTTDPAPFKPPHRGAFDFFKPVSTLLKSIQDSTTQAAGKIAAHNVQMASDKVRYAALNNDLKKVRGDIRSLEGKRRNPFLLIIRNKINNQLNGARRAEKRILDEIGKIKDRGNQPSPAEAAKLEIQGKLNELKDKYNNILEKTQKDPLVVMLSQSKVTHLKDQISVLEKQLKKL